MAKIPTIQEITSLIDKARSGDSSAFNELGELNNKLAKRANQRMSEIEKQSDIAHTSAYDRAQGFLADVSDTSTINKSGKMRFSQSRKMSLDDLEENLDNVSQFLRDDTSKVSSERYRRAEESYNTLVSRGYIEELSEKDRKKYFRFLETKAWEEIKKTIGTGFIKEARDAIAQNIKVGDLIKLYNQYKTQDNIDLFEITDAWISGKKKV